MKPQIVLLAIAFIVLGLGIANQLYEISKVAKIERPQQKYGEEKNFSFSTIDGGVFTREDLIPDVPIVIAYIDPECSACHNLMMKMVKYFDEFRNVHLVFVAETNEELAINFVAKYDLFNYPNVSLLIDSEGILYRNYKLTSTPSFLIFDSGVNLIMVVDDFQSFSILIKYVRKAVEASCN